MNCGFVLTTCTESGVLKSTPPCNLNPQDRPESLRVSCIRKISGCCCSSMFLQCTNPTYTPIHNLEQYTTLSLCAHGPYHNVISREKKWADHLSCSRSVEEFSSNQTGLYNRINCPSHQLVKPLEDKQKKFTRYLINIGATMKFKLN